MKKYVLNYYPKFSCVADKCKHTCCAGWNVIIDSHTLEEYKQEKSAFCTQLLKGINLKKSKFKVDRNGRCVFLNDNGLCEIIINLGEKSLCQVCADHPRFRSFFNNIEEMGLGFCCEQATSVILSFEQKIHPVLVYDDKNNCQLDFNEKNVLQFRTKVLEILQNRSLDINDRLEAFLKACNAKFLQKDFAKIIKIFLSFERIDKTWTQKLKNIRKKPFVEKTDKELEHYCEQFMVNSIYRYLSDAEDTMFVRARAIACIFAWWIIKSIIDAQKDLCENYFALVTDTVRAYSAEVEYSKKNLDKLFDFAYKFIHI